MDEKRVREIVREEVKALLEEGAAATGATVNVFQFADALIKKLENSTL